MTRAPNHPIDRLLLVMARLRDPDGGCPWDLEQDFGSIAPFTIEEAYEVADAIARGDMGGLREELGDLLLQVAYHARLAEEAGQFDFRDVADAIAEKMIARHPHVFGEASVASADAQTHAWEAVKAEERARKAGPAPASRLDDVPLALPALSRAQKLQKRAARAGFDWPEASQVIAKIEEELGEVRAELADRRPDRLEDEVGDLLFTVANLARFLGVDPEEALRRTNRKFERRFRAIEGALLSDGRRMEDEPLAELEARWQAAKAGEAG